MDYQSPLYLTVNIKCKSHFDLANRRLSPDTCEAVTRLRDFQKSEIPPGRIGQFQVAVDNLEACFSLASLSGSHVEPGCIFIWLYHLQDDLAMDLILYRPQALLLIAYFSVFLASIEKSSWYVKGWARQLLHQVVKRLADQPQFLELLQWPTKKVSALLETQVNGIGC